MKLRRESEAFLYPGQRRWFLWINVLFILENLWHIFKKEKATG